MKKKRVALYLRVSTNNGRQTVDNQQRELEAVAERSGWEIVATFSDKISGAKGRDKRPGLEALMKRSYRAGVRSRRRVVGRPSRPQPATSGPVVRRISGPERGPLPSPAARRQQHAVWPRPAPDERRLRRVRAGDIEGAHLRWSGSSSSRGQAPRPPSHAGCHRRRHPHAPRAGPRHTQDRQEAEVRHGPRSGDAEGSVMRFTPGERTVWRSKQEPYCARSSIPVPYRNVTVLPLTRHRNSIQRTLILFGHTTLKPRHAVDPTVAVFHFFTHVLLHLGVWKNQECFTFNALDCGLCNLRR